MKKGYEKAKFKGSLTLETALVLPVFMFIAISLVSFLEMMNLWAKVEFSLHETAREIALLTYSAQAVKTIGEDVIDTYGDKESGEENVFDVMEETDTDFLNPLLAETAVRAAFTERFGAGNLNNSLIKNGQAGIFFFKSEVSDENGNVDLIVTYKVEPLLNVFGINSLTFCNRVKMHAWTGYANNKTDSEEEYVYITENASVYHTNPHCTHLNISVSTVKTSEADTVRNSDGKKYHACEKCCGSGIPEDCFFVFITPYGESYHSKLSCSGLKRTVFRVKLSEVSDKKECERCLSYKEGRFGKEDESE